VSLVNGQVSVRRLHALVAAQSVAVFGECTLPFASSADAGGVEQVGEFLLVGESCGLVPALGIFLIGYCGSQHDGYRERVRVARFVLRGLIAHNL
jgi:hypothetical protein